MKKTGDDAPNLGELTNKIYSLLHSLEPDDRTRIIGSVTQLLGDPAISAHTVSPPAPTVFAGGSVSRSATPQPDTTPQQYFQDKAPQNKGEMLAVAAKYREDYQKAQSHTVDDFVNFFSEARQNFDRKNFGRDMENAQRQALLFNKGTPRGQYQLSYYGQQYVDALPDRDAVKKLRKPKGAARKVKAAKGTSKKKAS